MKKAMIYGFLAALTLTLGVACGKKDEDKATVSGGTGRDATINSARTPFVLNNSPQQLTQMVKALLSVSIDPSEIGNVTQVRVWAEVSLDRNTGVVIPSTSRIMLEITDDKVGQSDGQGGTYKAITVFLPALNGNSNATQANVVFGDNMGTITMVGNKNGTQFNGQLSFNNNQGNGYGGIRSGILGQFTAVTTQVFSQ